MTPSLITQQIRCNRCSRELPRWRVHQLAAHSGALCEYCLAGHLHALAVLGGAMPRYCQQCGRTREQLARLNPADPLLRLYVVPKDGILQMLCELCKEAYVRKRADLYKGTAYGHGELKL